VELAVVYETAGLADDEERENHPGNGERLFLRMGIMSLHLVRSTACRVVECPRYSPLMQAVKPTISERFR
jgi:hypothetical protein